MAVDEFSKGTYTNRVSTYPLRRKLTEIDPETGYPTGTVKYYDVELYEGTVTVQGTVWDKSTMDNLEDRVYTSVHQIKSEFTDTQYINDNTLDTTSKTVPGGINEVNAKAMNIALAFSTSSTYAVGDYCIYNNVLYKCTTAVSTAGDWDSSKWTATKVVDELGSGGGGGSSTFAGLSDVSLSNLQNGQIPKYNSTTQKWENANESGGGGGAVIDDTTTAVDKTWSSSKIDSTKADKASPAFTGSISLGRYSSTGSSSIAVGLSASAEGSGSAAFGIYTKANASYSFAANQGEVNPNTATYACAFNSGRIDAYAFGDKAAVFNSSKINDRGNFSFGIGKDTIIESNNQFVFGKYNVVDSNDTYAEIVGNGYLDDQQIPSVEVRSNARTLDWSGNEYLAGNLTLGGNVIGYIRQTDVTGTLAAGSTSITLSDASITTDSTIEVFNDLDVPYTSKTLATGSITLTFDAQQAAMSVKVRVS